MNFDDLLKNYEPTWKDHVRRTFGRIRNLKYVIKDFFFPWNVIKVKNMDRSWHDRDYVLMHAMFTIFVDFIEGEQPFVDWEIRHKNKRFTDVKAMREFVEKNYGENVPVDDEHGYTREQMQLHYLTKMELIWIYEWYVTGQWEFDYEKHNYSWEAERDHDKKCDDMLHRLVAWRHHFWT